MLTVKELVHYLLPNGSREKSRSIKKCPIWPPDAFAVAATLVGRSACYAKFRVGQGAPFQYLDEVEKNGNDWISLWEKARGNTDPTEVPTRVEEYWTTLVSSDAAVADNGTPDHPPAWWDAALKLLASADTACAGVGFHWQADPRKPEVRPSFISDVIRVVRLDSLSFDDRLSVLGDASICRQVQPDRACVQPKSRTAQVGSTLRSLSHHLALLPAVGEASAEWFLSPVIRTGQMNLLLVPFPYRIPSSAFKVTDRPIPGTGNYFSVSPDEWLLEKELRAGRVVEFLSGLIDEVKKQNGQVHGVVLPELALDLDTAEEVAHLLGVKYSGELELFISGVAGPGHNAVYTAAYDALGIVRWPWIQRKHHRWRLDAGQICRYRLAHVLDPSKMWWENTDLGERIIRLLVFRHGATVAALVCEDLARTDPAQVLLRSLGPNLVIALLLDGPQVQARWPGQYATVLADDPGSSVLTLTSLGMIRRVDDGSLPAPWQIGLWKEYGVSKAHEILLNEGSHAVLASFFLKDLEEHTLDRRSDGGTAIHVSFGQCRQITHPSPPTWITTLLANDS